MNSDRNKVREVFVEAVGLPAGEVSAFLDHACEGDAPLRLEVESLLAALSRRPEFLCSPTAGPGETATAEPGERVGEVLGQYKLLEVIGRGGFGTVYMADQLSPVRRRVALKIIKLGMDTRAVVARFEAERQALAMMDHPNIAQVHDAGATADGRPYFVMELVRGEPITSYADGMALNVPERLELFVQVCNAVQHAHSKGVIHRDIKPGNVLVSTQDGRAHAKVIDFGIAKATQEKLTERTLFTEFHQFIGTPEYMSPEQAGGAPDVDTRSDVYSLGTLLYELLAGVTPFDPGTLRAAAYDEIRRIIREVDPPVPSTRLSRRALLGHITMTRGDTPERRVARISGELDCIVMKAIDKDRARRYQTASALAEDVQRHLAGESVTAAPPTAWYRVLKFARRHRLLVGSVAAVTGALGLGMIGTTIGMVSANRARIDSDASARHAAAEQERAEGATHSATLAKERAEYEGYIANIESAYSAMRFNDTTRLRERLEACPTNRRDWEWDYLNAASDGSTLVMSHPRRVVNFAAVSMDGSRIVSSGGDGLVRLWNAATAVELATFGKAGTFRGRVGFSPEGAIIFGAATDGRLFVWDAVTHSEISILKGHAGAITFAAFADKSRLVSASEDGTARVWDVRAGVERSRLSHDEAIHRASLDATGTRLATASRDRTIKIWNLDSNAEPVVLRGHSNSVVHVAWSGDGRRVVSASYDGSARVWDAAEGREISRFQHGARVLFAALNPDGSRVVSSATTGRPRVWDADTGSELFDLEGHTNTLLGATFSRDGQLILTRSRDNSVRLWAATTGMEWACLRGHVESPWVAEFTPDGKHVMTCGDTTVRMWEVSPDSEQSIIAPPWVESTGYYLFPDESRVLAIAGSHVHEIELGSGTRTATFDRAGASGAAAITRDGTRVAVAFADHVVRIWNRDNRTDGTSLTGHQGTVYCVDYDKQGGRIVTASEDGAARVWNAETGQSLAVLRGHAGAVNSAGFDPSGERIVTAGRDGTVRVWDSRTGGELGVLRVPEGAALHAIFSPDGERILGTSTDYLARVWNAASAEELFVMRGHEHIVQRGAFSPDGRRIVTCSMDGTTRLWDATNGRQVLSMRGKSGGMSKAMFTSDGKKLFLSDTEGRAWLLDSRARRERSTQVRESLAR